MNLLHRLRSGGWLKWTRWTGRERAQVKSTRLTGRETRPGGGLKWTRWTGREEEGRRFRRLCFALHRLAPFAPYNRNKRDSILYPSSLPFSFLPLSLFSFLPLFRRHFLTSLLQDRCNVQIRPFWWSQRLLRRVYALETNHSPTYLCM